MSRHRARSVAVASAIALGLWQAPREVRACDCNGPDESFDELVKAEQVFEAEILENLRFRTNDNRCLLHVKVLRAWKGTTTADDTPIHNECWCSKGGLERGKSYIFYTRKDQHGPRSIGMCSRVVPSDDAKRDLAELGPPTHVRDPKQPSPISPPPPAPSPDKHRWRPVRMPACSTGAPGSSDERSGASSWLLVALGCLARAGRRTWAHGNSLWPMLLIAPLLLSGCDYFTEPCTTDAECGSKGACAGDGWCYESATYCQDTEDCSVSARCTLRDGSCIVGPQDDCSKTWMCRSRGECHNADGTCVIQTTQDCAGSDGCRTYGACTFDQGRCIQREDDCRKAAIACGRDGRCTLQGRFCRAATSADCAESIRCKTYGACLDRNGKCIRSCEKWSGCIRDGLCADNGATCVPDADGCQRSEACTQDGRCTFEKGRGACLAGSDEDCRSSAGCAQHGQCHRTESGRCTALTSEDCGGSKGCKEDGACGRDKDGWCKPSSDQDCAGSEGCRKKGRCTLRHGTCVAS